MSSHRGLDPSQYCPTPPASVSHVCAPLRSRGLAPTRYGRWVALRSRLNGQKKSQKSARLGGGSRRRTRTVRRWASKTASSLRSLAAQARCGPARTLTRRSRGHHASVKLRARVSDGCRATRCSALCPCAPLENRAHPVSDCPATSQRLKNAVSDCHLSAILASRGGEPLFQSVTEPATAAAAGGSPGPPGEPEVPFPPPRAPSPSYKKLFSRSR